MQILKRELLKESRGDPAKQKKFLDIVASEIERLDELVRNFLLIARPRTLKISRCDVNAILEEVLLSQEERAKKEVEQAVEFATEAPYPEISEASYPVYVEDRVDD